MAIRIRYRQDGTRRYQARIFLGHDDQRKRIEAIRTFRTKRDALSWERDQRVALDKGTFVRPSDEPLGRYLRRWMAGPMRQAVRERTWQNYDRALQRYVYGSALTHVPLAKLNAEKLEGFYSRLAEFGAPGPACGPLGARSVRHVHAILHTALRKAAKDRLISANPASGVTLPKDQQRERNQLPSESGPKIRILSAQQVDRLLEVSDRPPPPKSGFGSGKRSRSWSWKSTRSRNRWHALWHVLVNGGLRPSEALALTWKDVDWEHTQVHVKKALVTGLKGGGWIIERPKTERSVRTVMLPAETMDALREHRGLQLIEKEVAGNRYTDHGLVFAGELGAPADLKNATQRHFRDLLAAAGIPHIRMYDLRHTHASLMLSAGVPVHIVSARLGHASAKMTLDVYGHVLPNQQQDAVETYELYLKTEAAR